MGLSDEQLQVECAALMLNWMPPEERDALHRRIGELEADRARRAEPQEAARQFQPTDECRRQFTAPAEPQGRTECPDCDHHPQCKTCDGKGWVPHPDRYMTRTTCDKCHGSGGVADPPTEGRTDTERLDWMEQQSSFMELRLGDFGWELETMEGEYCNRHQSAHEAIDAAMDAERKEGE